MSLKIQVVAIAALVALVLIHAPTPAAADTCASCYNQGEDWFCPSKQKCHSTHVMCALECKQPCQQTSSCVQGCTSAGYNCTCQQCAAGGFSNYCPLANECYHSETTCAISCGANNCQTTAACTASPVCTAQQSASMNNCGGSGTCCVDENGSAFCSPYANATCCQYGQMTCPSTYTCYPPAGKCLPPPPTPPPTCQECMNIVAKIETDGCDDCAQLFPNSTWICSLIQKAGLCAWIQQKGLPASNVCETLGMCGLGGCACGYCRPQLYGQWCLSLPNKCPNNASAPVLALRDGRRPADRLFASVHERDAHYQAAAERAVRALEHQQTLKQQGPLGDFCVDGHCDEAHAGCCLTCAP